MEQQTIISMEQKRTKLFFDTEFTGLHKNTTIISLGIVSECGKTFYAEFTDYDKEQVNAWIYENVIDKLRLSKHITVSCGGWEKHINETRNFDNALEAALANMDMSEYECVGKAAMIKNRLEKWLNQFDKVEMWSDCLAYDWVLFCELFGDAFSIPLNVYYIPFDIATLFKEKGIDPDISREKYAFGEIYSEMLKSKHNAISDAKLIKACYEKLQGVNNTNR